MRTSNESTFIERQRRDQIIAAAIPLLAQHGPGALTFARIADSAGISPGLITYHFQTKAELMRSIAQTLTEQLDRAMTPAEEADSYVTALYLMISGFVRHCGEHPEAMLALNQLDRAATGAEQSRRGSSDLAELAQMMADGQAEGEYRAGDPRTLAVATMAIMYAVPREIATRPVHDLDTFAAETATAVVHAVADVERAPVRRRLARLARLTG